MTNKHDYDAIIIGGSYSGLSAGMALGRALRKVLIIDSGKPCNIQTPYSHNFLTQDGKTPSEISALARQQVARYSTVEFYDGLAVSGRKTDNGFEIISEANHTFFARTLIFASGVKDIMPDIPGFAECWGISVIHCPYCHGYEVKNAKTGILANGDVAMHYAQLINNWTKDLTIFTNGSSELEPEQMQQITKHNIQVVEKAISFLEHHNGKVSEIVFTDASRFQLKAIYSGPQIEQHCKIPTALGCELTEEGLLVIDGFQKTSVDNVFACGDNSNPLRTVSNAVAAGTVAGAMVNNVVTQAEFC